MQQHRSMHSAGSVTDDSKTEYIRHASSDNADREYLPAAAAMQPESYDTHDGIGPQAGQGSASIEQYAIRMLYEEFRDRAASKIDSILELRFDSEPDLSKYLELGADSVFDRTLEKLGMLARRRPRVLIELLLVWRKTTIDATDEYPLEGADSISQADGARQQLSLPSAPALSRAHYIVKERRSLASVYILCRALSAVVEQLEASHLEGDLGDRLEELVFGQVKQVNPANLRRSQNRRQIQDLYARLIGRISDIRFASMSDRFIAELERIPMVSSGNDERIVVLLHNMRYLRMRVFPIDALEESSAFLLSCAKFYSRTSGSLRLKHAWATLLTEWLMPMAAVVGVEVNLPELVQAIDIIFAKAMKMAAKVRHVHVSFPLAAATLCISRRDAFHQRWLSLLEHCIQRLKDKQFRRVSMDAILRLLWVYLFRYPEPSAVVIRRIDSLSRIFFPATKLHAWPKMVPPSAFVYFLVCAACYNFDFAMRQLLLNMLQAEGRWLGTTREITEVGPALDSLNPARVGLAYQALVAMALIAGSRASPKSTNAGSSGDSDARAGGNNVVGSGSGPETASAGNGDSEMLPGKSQASVSLYPPFPGVGQLSGLDFFSMDLQPKKGSNALSTGKSAGGLKISGSTERGAGQAADSLPYAKATQLLSINPELLPENIRLALATATSIMQRYFNALNSMFGQYMLADERLWRLTRTVPPFSSVVLTGTAFSIENTATFSTLLLPDSSSHGRPNISHGSDSGAGGGGGGGGAGSGSGVGPISSTAFARGDGMSDGRYHDGIAVNNFGTAGTVDALLGATGDNDSSTGLYSVAASIRHAVVRYPAERQGYVDLMTVYTRIVPRVQTMLELNDRRKVVETMVQNVLSVDQALASESRACLLDLLCPVSPLYGQQRDGERVFASRQEQLEGIMHAVFRATQLLRAIDERYNEILVGGIFSRDARSSMSIAQPGDPLADELRAWPPSQQPLTHASARRFMHAANLSSGSTASNNDAGRAARGAISDSEGNADESWACHVTSASRQQRDDADSECDSGTSSAAASVAALDAKARLERSTWSSSTGSSGHELNGGFLHLCVDLLQYLEMSLCECQQGDGGGGINMSKKSPNVAFAAADDPVPAASSGAGQDAPAADGRMVGGHTVGEWARLVQAVEANAVALLCSSSARVRHAAVGLLYRAGALRLVLASNEPVPAEGHSWTFRGAESAYEVLNVMVPLQESTGGIEVWDVPFESADPAEMPPRQRSRPQQPLARLAASLHAADAGAWAEHFPSFVARASARMPEAMLVARTLVCQRLYQMQPLMAHYAEVPVRAGSGGSHHVRTTGTRAHAAAVVVRPDLTAAFGSLLLFAVISLPSGDQRGASGNSGPFGETVVGNRSPRNGSAFGSSRLAKSIARKLAPLKSSTRGSRLEHGTGLISITQLVRMAGALLRSDNAPLRQSAALALCHTPPAYLHELMLELRPLAESLFDDGSALASHRNYLHVSGISGHAAASGGGSAREGLLSALSHGLSASPGSATQSISGGSPRPPAQQIHRAGSGLLPTAQLAPHAAPKRRSNRAANTTLGRDGSGDGGHGSDTEATSDSGTQISRAGQGRRASSFDAASTTTGAVANTNASSAATAAANAAAIAAVSAGSGSASQIRRKRLRLSLAQIYRQVSRQLSSVYPDEQVLTQLISYIRETKSFLSESLVQGELEYQQLRIYFCGLVEALYYAISSLPLSEFASSASITESGLRPARDAPRQKFTFETRIGLYQMFERWCSLGRYADWSREAHGRMAAAALDPLKNSGERVLVADMVDSQKRRLEVASLRSMAVLCRDVAHTQTLPSGIIGNVKETDSPAGSTKTGSGPRDKAALFTWISDALDHPDTHIQRVGQRAVEWTIGFDPSDAAMVRVLVQLAYGVSVASSVASASAVGSGGSSASMDFQGMHTDLRNGSTSGLRLMFGGEPAAGASTAKTGASSVHVTLSTHRVALGYLRALTSILAPSRVAATLATPRSGVGKALSLEYASLVLPLVLFQLRSERHKIRRQALLLLRVLCTHMSVHSCLDKLDELGPSIVSDIPAIATSAASRLTVAVAASFAAHSDIVILECVRQVHMQGGIAARLTMLLDLLKPWLGHIELRTVTGDNGARLEPVALSRDTLVVLRCMLYLTTKAGLNSINCIHEMWMMLVDGAAQEANMWLVMRYLTGLLMHTQSVALLGYMRRIAVFLSRSSQGQQLVQQLVDEATRPSASVPIEADNVIAHNTINEVLPSEPWTTDFLFPPRHSRVMVSTGGLAIFYLGAISYEQRGLVAEHAALAALPPAVFCLAHPERWVRDAARTLLVNLAAGERAWCTASIATVAGGSNALADAAHTV
ncbi:Cell morphogenesis protein PAG1, partial [Coemansia thaxteri]